MTLEFLDQINTKSVFPNQKNEYYRQNKSKNKKVYFSEKRILPVENTQKN